MNDYNTINEDNENEIDNENKNDNEKNPLEKYIGKEKEVLEKRKADLFADLNDVAKRLEKEENIDTFLNNNVDDILGISHVIREGVGIVCSWIVIKIIGTIFITLYFIGILEVIGLMNTLKEEIKASLNLTLRDKKRETDFYQNYLDENLQMPSFDVFFLSSIFSSFFINFFSFPGSVVIVLFLNIIIIFFGLGYFDFHSGESLNQKYTFNENVYLIGLYILINLFLGIIALFPHDLLQKGYILYDLKKGNDFVIKNGYIFMYLFSMEISSIFKMILDRKYVFDIVRVIINEEKENKDNSVFLFAILLIYILSMISSLIFYIPYYCIFKTKEDDSNSSHNAIKIFGYVIYIETTSGKCCADCNVALEKCGACLGCNLCNCCICCTCCCSGLNEIENGTKKICIVYKLKGYCSWLCDLLAAYDISKLVFLMVLFELINLGFNPELSQYLSSNISEKEILISNIISFSSILIFYFLNIFIGFIFLSYTSLGKYKIGFLSKSLSTKIIKSERLFIYQSLFPFLLIIMIINTIISAFFHYKAIQSVIYYFIAYSTSIGEYGNIIFLYLFDSDERSLDIIKGSFAISFYRTIIEICKAIIGVFDFQNEGLIFFQFVFGCVVSILLGLIIELSMLFAKCMNNNNIDNTE